MAQAAVLQEWREMATITVDHSALVLGVSRATAYEAARTGQLPTIKVGRRILVPTAQLRQMLGEVGGRAA